MLQQSLKRLLNPPTHPSIYYNNNKVEVKFLGKFHSPRRMVPVRVIISCQKELFYLMYYVVYGLSAVCLDGLYH